MTHRLAVWADRKLLPAVVSLLLLADLLIGANWLLSPDSSLTSPIYDTAKRIMPMHEHGQLFIALAVVASAVTVYRGRSWLTGFLVGPVLACLHVFWAVLFTLVPLGRPGASYLAAIVFGLVLLPLHLLAGVALTRPADGP